MFPFLKKWFKKKSSTIDRVLVVGGAGHVGRLILPLLAREFSLTVFDLNAPPSGPWKFIYGDVVNLKSLDKALRGADVLLYLARGTKNQNINNVVSAYDVNAKGVHLALDAAVRSGVKRVIYTSTLSVYDYGDLTSGAFDKEDVIPKAKTVYGFTKFLGEEVCKFFYDRYQLPVLILRLFLPVSDEEYQKKSSDDPVDCRTKASDLARAIVSALKSTHNGLEIIHVTGDTTGRAYHHEKAKKILGWEPQAK